jgi:hypothetical protein
MPEREIPMMKYRLVCWFVTVAALIGLAAAQTSPVHSSSAKSAPDPVKAATKPLTPKSAMPSNRKSSAVVPNPSTSDGKTSAELNRLERQPIEAGGSKSATPAKGASAPKSTGTSAGSGSGINFKYQQPTGGMKATTPDANSKNSSTPRVKKN